MLPNHHPHSIATVRDQPNESLQARRFDLELQRGPGRNNPAGSAVSVVQVSPA